MQSFATLLLAVDAATLDGGSLLIGGLIGAAAIAFFAVAVYLLSSRRPPSLTPLITSETEKLKSGVNSESQSRG